MRQRRGDEEALIAIATPLLDERELIRTFDALDHSLQPKLTCQADEGCEQDSVLLPFNDFSDEPAIHFDDIERESRQIAEAGIAAPKIVDEKP